MPDYSKPFPCGECGQMVRSSEKHTYEDCLKYKKRRKCPTCNGKGTIYDANVGNSVGGSK